ncbi:hypothetical protein PybrP1_004190 [[Pythium] brassicae (nom. inval.)]|nr:hypothetical protein PybrP1_004190 [[Pythium] brassicae (nom. inval.)]
MRALWAVIVLIHALCAAYYASLALVYFTLPGTLVGDHMRAFGIVISFDKLPVIEFCFAVCAVAHALLLSEMLITSAYRRSPAFYSKVGIKTLKSAPHPTGRRGSVWERWFGFAGYFGAGGKHFVLLFLTREVLEATLQSIQAYQLSKFVPHIVLDIASSIGVSLALGATYLGDYDWTLTNFVYAKWSDQVWFANLNSEFKQLFIQDWFDFGTRALFAITTLMSLNDVKLLRFETLLHTALILWGALILSLHIQGMMKSSADPAECLAVVHPWLASSATCASIRIDCRAHEGMTGKAVEVEARWSNLDPQALSMLTFINCPELHIPASIQSFSGLKALYISSSTVIEWSENAALAGRRHLELRQLSLIATNMTPACDPSSSLPPGLLSNDFPQTLGTLYTTHVALGKLPKNLHEIWPHRLSLILLLGSFSVIPEVLPRLDPISLLDTKISRLPVWAEGESFRSRVTVKAARTPFCAQLAKQVDAESSSLRFSFAGMGVMATLRALWVRAFPWTARQGGRYSVELMCDLSEYCEHTPLWRVFLVFALSVLPSLGAIVSLDTIPLQDPYGGWNKNPSMWTRCVLGTFVLSMGVLMQFRGMAVSIELSMKQTIALGVAAAINTQGATLLIAMSWGVFPLPFTMIWATPVWTITIAAGIMLAIGRERIVADSEIRVQLKRYLDVANAASVYIVVFPAYSTVFQKLEGVSQFAFILVLPVLKFFLKKIMKNLVASVDELVPVTIITVDLFNALFQAKCMQSAGSLWTTAGIIAVDAIQNGYTMRKLVFLMADVHKTMGVQQRDRDSSDLLAQCVALLETPEHLNLRDIRCQRQISSVVPFHPDQADAAASSSTASTAATTDATRSAILAETLQLLWKCECVLLVEFVEFAAPMMYSISLAVVHSLPNARYYPGIANMTEAKLHSTIGSILLYAGLEFLSLLYMHMALKRMFRISALYLLAFVLERKRLILQGIFMTWALIVLSFTLVHNGNDLTFKFEWMHRQRQRPSG